MSTRRGDGTERSMEYDEGKLQSTNASTLDDLFEQFHSEISFDLKLMSRGEDKPMHVKPTESVTSRHNTDIEIQDEMERWLQLCQ